MGRGRLYGCPAECDPELPYQKVPGGKADVGLYSLDCGLAGCPFRMYMNYSQAAFLVVSDVPGSAGPTRANPPFELRCEMSPSVNDHDRLQVAYVTHNGYDAAKKVRFVLM